MNLDVLIKRFGSSDLTVNSFCGGFLAGYSYFIHGKVRGKILKFKMAPLYIINPTGSANNGELII